MPLAAQAMPPLPGAAVEGPTDILEEPHSLGQVSSVRECFSPNGTLVRNSTPLVGTPTLIATSSAATQLSGLTGSTAISARERLLRIYTDKDSSYKLTTYDKTNIADVTKDNILGRIKFILPDRKFTSFWQPDLLTNTPPYVDAFFEAYGYRFVNRKTDVNVLEQAAELWKAAAPRIKKIIDNHRSGVAQKMKSDVLQGKMNV